MKKYYPAFIAFTLFVFIGCGSKNNISVPEQTLSPLPVISVSSTPITLPKISGVQEKKIGVDLDLTKMSSTMVYAEVNNMMTSPEDFVDKTVRMKGTFVIYQAISSNGEPLPDMRYYACVIADATACCQQGLEFVLGENAKYPDDYPEIGTEITVVGKFRTYLEGQYMYCHLVDAVIEQ